MKLLILCLLLAAAPTYASIPPVAELPDIVEKTLPGVVNVSSTTIVSYRVFGMEDFLGLWGLPRERKQTQSSLGSGFIIDTDGFVLTNNHVVEHADEVMVTLLDKRQFRARIVGKDRKMDLALLQIRDESHHVPANIKSVPMGDSDKVRIAEFVFAVGNPFALQHTVTTGIISAKNRTIGQGPFDNFLQTDASINPGNSGGPLFNLKGEVIGINTAIYSQTGQSGGLGFAIPVNEAKTALADLKRYGRVPRPWLGVVAQPMNQQLAAYFHLPNVQGVLIDNLVQDGPAENAGLKRGDIIVKVDNDATHESYAVERALAKHKPTDTATLTINREGRSRDVRVKLSELPKIEGIPDGIL